MLSWKRTTKMLHGCAGWSAPLLFAYGINRFSHDVAHFVVKGLSVCLFSSCSVPGIKGRIGKYLHSRQECFIKVNEKSRECHSLKPQPTPNTKRKRKKTKSNSCNLNIQMHEKHIDQLRLSYPSEVITMLNRTEKKIRKLDMAGPYRHVNRGYTIINISPLLYTAAFFSRSYMFMNSQKAERAINDFSFLGC